MLIGMLLHSGVAEGWPGVAMATPNEGLATPVATPNGVGDILYNFLHSDNANK